MKTIVMHQIIPLHCQTRMSSGGILIAALEIVEISLWKSGRLCDVMKKLRTVSAMTKYACLPPTPKESDTIVIGGLDLCKPVRRSFRTPKNLRRTLSILERCERRVLLTQIPLSKQDSTLLVFQLDLEVKFQRKDLRFLKDEH